MLADLLHAATVLVDRLTTLDQWSVLLFTYLSSAVEMTFLLGLLVPGESVVMLAASLHGPGGFALAVATGTAGALTGQIAGYAVGRLFGNRLRTTALGRRIGAERFDRAEAYLRERGAPALVAVRFVAVIHAIVPIVAGVARMPFGRFVGWSALGTVLWVGTFAGVGAATASADSTGGIGVVLTAIGATCLGVVPFAVRLFRRPAKRGVAVESAAVTLAVEATEERDLVTAGGPARVLADSSDPARVLAGPGGPARVLAGSGGPARVQPGSGDPARVQPGSGDPARVQPGSGGPVRVQPGSVGPAPVLPGRVLRPAGASALLDRRAGAEPGLDEPARRHDGDLVGDAAPSVRRGPQQARRRAERRAGRVPGHHPAPRQRTVDRRLPVDSAAL